METGVRHGTWLQLLILSLVCIADEQADLILIQQKDLGHHRGGYSIGEFKRATIAIWPRWCICLMCNAGIRTSFICHIMVRNELESGIRAFDSKGG